MTVGRTRKKEVEKRSKNLSRKLKKVLKKGIFNIADESGIRKKINTKIEQVLNRIDLLKQMKALRLE